MAFTLPTFNLAVNLWRHGNGPPNAPDTVTVGNLTLGRRVFSGPDADLSVGIDSMFRYLLIPRLITCYGKWAGGGTDMAEVPAGSGRFYTVQDCDDVASNFANWHQQALLIPISPFPPGSGVGPCTCVPLAFPLTTYPSGSISASVTFPAGSGVACVVDMNGVSSTGVMVSTLSGTLTPIASQPLVLSSGATGTILWYAWATVAGADTLTYVAANSGLQEMTVYATSRRVLDASGGVSSTASPVVLATSGPTTGPSDLVLATVVYNNVTRGTTWSGVWSFWPTVPGWQSGDPGGVVFDCGQSAYQLSVPVSTPGTSIALAAGSTLGGGSIIALK